MTQQIREATAADGPAVAAIYAHYVRNTPITFEEDSPSGDEMARRITDTLKTHPYLIAHADGAIAGFAYGTTHRARASYRWSVDVSIYLDQRFHRRGIGRALYAKLLHLLTRQGFIMAYAGITLPNDASVGLHESIGFSQIATYRNVGFKFGAWRDVGWWEKQLAPPFPNPSEPIPWPPLRAQLEASILP